MSRVPRSSHAFLLTLLATVSACGDAPTTNAPLTPSLADVGAVAAPSIAGSPGDQAAMQQIVSTLDATWTAGDGVAYAAVYGTAEWVGPNGRILTDPAAIRATYVFLFQTVFPNTTRVSSIRNLTFLTGTIAVLDINATVLAGGQVIAQAREKNILIKRGGEWHIVQHQQVPLGPGGVL